MIVTNFSADGFKNLKDVDIQPDPFLNIICGDNAQGKTNLIEAIWLCSGVKSFRGTKDKNFIDVDRDSVKISLTFKDAQREQKLEIRTEKPIVRDKTVLKNGVRLDAVSKLFGSLRCVIFTPEDLELSKGSPENRRSFLDHCISQIKPTYSDVVSRYENVLQQRNALLKELDDYTCFHDPEELESWNMQMAKLGSYISLMRNVYTKKLNAVAGDIYNKLSGGSEILTMYYDSTIFENLDDFRNYDSEMFDKYTLVLERCENNDVKTGFTQAGVHRDELVTVINDMPTREFASQGQNRSVSLALKLAQAYILLEETGDAPIILLDDVLSELDRTRQKYILSSISNMQVFITCCDKRDIAEFENGKLFNVKDGRIAE